MTTAQGHAGMLGALESGCTTGLCAHMHPAWSILTGKMVGGWLACSRSVAGTLGSSGEVKLMRPLTPCTRDKGAVAAGWH